MRDRFKAALATALIEGVVGYALFAGFAVSIRSVTDNDIALFEIAPEKPPLPSPLPQPAHAHKAKDAAAPPNIRSRATQIVAPLPIVPTIVPPPPIVSAPATGSGDEASTGAAIFAGPGTGAGGTGVGTGGGGNGPGSRESPPKHIGGRLKDSDFPRAAAEAHAQGTVSVRFAVQPDGRIDTCMVTRSSGNADLDATTCRLIQQRYRFKPARDERGAPVRAYVVEDHSWFIEEESKDR